MILLRDFALYVLPVLVATGGWLFAVSLRKQTQAARATHASRWHERRRAALLGREGQRAVASCARTDVRKWS